MESSGGFEVHCCSFFVEIRTPHGLVFQGGRGGWLLHRQISVFYAGGEYDLCFCVSVFLELPDESIKLHCAREAYFNQHGVCTGNAVTLQNVRTCLDKRVEFRFPFWIERHVYKGCNVIPERHWGNTCVIAGDDSAFL